MTLHASAELCAQHKKKTKRTMKKGDFASLWRNTDSPE